MPCALTVIIPCYNESGRLDALFALIRAEQDRRWEWLFVDDGSTDQTAELIRGFAAECPQAGVRLLSYQPNRGKGAAVREALLQADGALCGFVDADLAASPLEFARFADDPAVRDGSVLVIGSRATRDGSHAIRRDWHRYLIGRIFAAYVRLVSGLGLSDTQCGFKLMSQSLARKLAAAMVCDGFAFDVELLMLARRGGVAVREEGISWEEREGSHVRLGHILRMATDLWKIRRRLDGRLASDR